MRTHQFMQTNEMRVLNKTFMKYRILTIRMKISFEAARRQRTVNEHLINQIIKTHGRMVKDSLIIVNKRTAEMHE